MDHQIKILFLCPYPYDKVASQRFRFEQYFELLTENNIQFKLKSFYSDWTYRILYLEKRVFFKIIGTIYGLLKRLIHLFYCISYDYIFIHRELTPIGPPVFEWFIAKVLCKKIIYDFDDAIWIPNTSEENRFISRIKYHKKFNAICRWAYKISCCNDFLAEHSKKYNQNTEIIPTTIDTQKFAPENIKNSNTNQVIIGWTGTHSTLPYLLPVIDLISSITKNNPEVHFRIICDKKPEWHFPNMQYVRWNKDTEVDDLRDIDIGIMPLPETDWASGKCGFKILQYFSLAIPAIASPIGINKKIIIHGKNGYLCTNEKEWINHINQLIVSNEFREVLGKNGRKTVEKYYSIKANRKRFLDLFV